MSTVVSGNTSKVHKSRETILEFLKNLKYNISDYENTSINEVHIMIQNKQLDMLVENSDKNKVYIKYHLAKSLRPQYVHDIVEDLFSIEQVLDPKDSLFIVIKDEPNETMTNLLKQMYADQGIYIAVFNIARLQFNILEHSMVSPHTKLPSEEEVQFKKTYNVVNNDQLPTISRFDPVALAIALRPGEICKIERPSKISIKGDYYRICINN